MITVSDPWASDPEGVPGAMPAGIYVRFCDGEQSTGKEIAIAKLDALGGPRWIVWLPSISTWFLGSRTFDYVTPALASAGMLHANVDAFIAEAQSKGVTL